MDLFQIIGDRIFVAEVVDRALQGHYAIRHRVVHVIQIHKRRPLEVKDDIPFDVSIGTSVPGTSLSLLYVIQWNLKKTP